MEPYLVISLGWQEETLAVGYEEMERVCTYAAVAKNRRVDCSGHSARERVYGRVDRLPGSALDSFLEKESLPSDDSSRQHHLFRRAVQFREAPCAALVRLDHADRYRRTGSHAPRVLPQGFLTRTQVFYWRAARTKKGIKATIAQKGRRAREAERWHGPAIVVGVEKHADGRARAYWITQSAQALLVAPEHLRLATRQEQMLPGAVAYLLRLTSEELDQDDDRDYEDLTQHVDVPMGEAALAAEAPGPSPEPERDVSPVRRLPLKSSKSQRLLDKLTWIMRICPHWRRERVGNRPLGHDGRRARR